MPKFSPLTTATRVSASVQIDGRIAVREKHETDFGDVEFRDYVAEAEDDLDAMLEANSGLFLERLATK